MLRTEGLACWLLRRIVIVHREASKEHRAQTPRQSNAYRSFGTSGSALGRRRDGQQFGQAQKVGGRNLEGPARDFRLVETPKGFVAAWLGADGDHPSRRSGPAVFAEIFF